MQKNNNNNTNDKPKAKKKSAFGAVLAALGLVIVLISVSYTAFITVVGVGGRTNLYLAAPSIIAVAGIIVYAVVFTAINATKRK